MSNLLQKFEQQSERVSTVLDSCSDAAELSRVAIAEVNRFLDTSVKSGEAISPREEALIADFFSPLLDALRLLAKVRPGELPANSPERESAMVADRRADWRVPAAGVVVATAGAAAVPTAGLSLVVGLAGGYAATKLVEKYAGGDVEVNAVVSEPPEPTLKIDSELVFQQVREWMRRFDAIAGLVAQPKLDTEQRDSKRPTNIRDLANVLDFFHVMLEARLTDSSISPELAGYLGIIERILGTYGIRTVSYGERTSDDQFYIRERSSSINEPKTIRPALTADGAIIAKGYVVLPAGEVH